MHGQLLRLNTGKSFTVTDNWNKILEMRNKLVPTFIALPDVFTVTLSGYNLASIFSLLSFCVSESLLFFFRLNSDCHILSMASIT